MPSEQIKWLKKITPKQIFLIDAIGGLLTFLSLSFLLPIFHELLGVPRDILIQLGLGGLCYMAFSMSCFYFVRIRFAPFLKAIILANLAYCVLVAGVVTYYLDEITFLGMGYFAFETLVILSLVALEMSVLRRIVANNEV